MKLKKQISHISQWLFNDGTLPIQLRIMTADQIQSTPHLHKTMAEYFYLLKGTMKISVNNREITMGTDDLLVVEAGETHHVVQTSADLLIMLLMPPPVANDKVILPDPENREILH